MKFLLAACRRILLAVLAALALFGGWLYWQAPSLNELRPELQGLLVRQLDLKELHIGHLSWRWAGYIWLKADNITFAGAQQRIRVDDAQLEVRLSTWDLMRGNIRPISLNLLHGHITLHIPKADAGESFPLISGMLHIEDSTVTLNYGKFSNRFDHLNLHLDADRRALGMQLPGFNLDVRWNEGMQPERVQARFDNLDWLPESWRASTRGNFSAHLQINKVAERSDWQLLADIRSDSGIEILNSIGQSLLPVNKAHLKALIHAAANPLDIMAIDWQQLGWQAGDDKLAAHGSWADGKLQLALRSDMLRLATLAAWAMPLADKARQVWLAGLTGSLQDVQAELHMTQTLPWSLPEFAALRQGDLQLTAGLSNASIPLANPEELLQKVNGTLKLDAQGLRMQVNSMHLPHQAGRVEGQLHITDLANPVFNIEGKGEIDVGLCESWLGTTRLPHLRWKASPSEARFTLSWPMHAVLPDKGEAKFTPQPAWQVEFRQRPLSLSGGSMLWQAGGALSFKGMHIAYDEMNARFDLQLKGSAADKWELMGLNLKSSGDFAALVNRFRLPLDGAAGRYAVAVNFDPAQDKTPLQFELDLRDAAWLHLLGSQKKSGEPYALRLLGRQTDDGLSIKRIQSVGGSPVVSGTGEINQQHATLHIDALQAPAFRGAVSINAPVAWLESGDAPLEIDVNSEFLDQAALPDQFPDVDKLAGVSDKPGVSGKSEAKHKWVLRGKFNHIRWDAASFRGVRVYFASAAQGIGRLEADALDAAQFSVQDVRTSFHLAANRHVDVISLNARLLGQNLHLSGTVQPETGGGLRWSGFANINGDFSQIIHRLDAAKLFQGGVVHALWSGSGVIRQDMPWWNAMRGQLRLRSDNGRILEGGTMTKLLAAFSLADLPRFLTGTRKDMTGPGMLYKRLQLESTVQGETANVRQLALRASALDMSGKGRINLADGTVDLFVAARPLQNIDAFLRMVPLLRDLLLGPAKSLFRKIYHVHGPLQSAAVDAATPEQANLPDDGLLEQFISLPGRLFDSAKKTPEQDAPALP